MKSQKLKINILVNEEIENIGRFILHTIQNIVYLLGQKNVDYFGEERGGGGVWGVVCMSLSNAGSAIE